MLFWTMSVGYKKFRTWPDGEVTFSKDAVTLKSNTSWGHASSMPNMSVPTSEIAHLGLGEREGFYFVELVFRDAARVPTQITEVANKKTLEDITEQGEFLFALTGIPFNKQNDPERSVG
jgi:hypothetical protein